MFEGLGSNSSLQRLDFRQNHVGAAAAARLAAALASGSDLRSLHLGGCWITDATVPLIAAIVPAFWKLQELDLGECSLGGDGVVRVLEAALDSSSGLSSLCLAGNGSIEGGRAAQAAVLLRKHGVATIL